MHSGTVCPVQQIGKQDGSIYASSVAIVITSLASSQPSVGHSDPLSAHK